MVFSLMRAIVLDTLRALDIAGHSCMSLLLAILILRDTRIYVGFSNGSNKLPYIKTPINKTFGLASALNIPNIDPNNQHVGLR